MTEIIRIDNFPKFIFLQETSLSADATEGASSISIVNEQGFDTSHPILIGRPGNDEAEIRTPSSVSDELIEIDALDHPHKAGTPVYSLRANKARIYRATNVDGNKPIATSYNLLDTVNLVGDLLFTEYSDASGGSGYWYLYTFVNDVASPEKETEKNASSAVRGGGYGRYVTVDEVRTEAGLNSNPWITDTIIYSKLIKAEAEINSLLASAGYSLPLSSVPENVKHANILLAAGYILTADYGSRHSGLSKDGENKISQAKEILNNIREGGSPLIDESGSRVATEAQIGGYPDDTAEDANPTEKRMFRITDVF